MHWQHGFFPLLPLIWIGIIALICWGARQRFRHRQRFPFSYPYETPAQEPSAMEILRRRYARGEIDGTTFDQMRERLESSGSPRY